MTRFPRLAVLVPVAIALSIAPSYPERSRTFPLSEVRPGQIAVAKSVFRGTTVESFHLRIVGVIPKYDGSRSIILGRILDGTVVKRNSGTVAGMSGSPVYVGGRLAGAISMAWPWSKEPVCGITPIQDMLEAFQTMGKSSPVIAEGSSRPVAPVRVGSATIGRVQVAPTVPRQPDAPGVMTLVPLGGFVQVSGFNQRGLERVRELLAPYGLRVGGVGGGVEEKMRPPIVPGGAVGARLVGGDFDMTALGTITTVVDGKVLAFGHPLFQRGDVDLPMTGGYVYDILPNVQISNKIMSPTQVVGRISRDHQTAIAGTIGGKADMLPVTIEALDSDLGRSRTFHVEVARIRELTPGLIAASVMVAVDQMRGETGRGTARVRMEMQAAGRTIVREDSEYSAMDAASVAVPEVLGPLNALAENPFGAVRVDRVFVRVTTSQERRTAVIDRVTLSQARVKAGDELTFSVTIHPYGQNEIDIPVRAKLPPDLPKGQMRVAVTAGSAAEPARAAIGAPRPAPEGIEQIIDRYVDEPKGTEVVLQAALPQSGLALSGAELPSLPRTAVEALGATRPTDMRPTPSVLRVVVPTDWVLSGRQMLTVQVESPIALPGPRAPREAGGPPEEEPQPEEEASVMSPISTGMAAVESVKLGAAPPHAAPQGQPGQGPKPAENDGETKETALTRPPDEWTDSSAADYENAKLTDVKLAADGALSLTLKQRVLGLVTDDVIWSVTARDGVVYLGTGKRGRVYRVTGDGQVASFAATGEMNVHALAVAPDGTLYAGTSPKGRVIRIDSAGKVDPLFDSGGTYIWALLVGADETVYAGGGAPGRVYAIRPKSPATLLAELPVSNVLSLALGGDGTLYAGTADAGLIFRIAPDGKTSTVGQVPGASVNALALDGKGNLYATCSPGGRIYRARIGDGMNEPELYLETGEQSAFGLALLPDGTPVVATGPRGLVVRAAEKLRPEMLFRPESGIATAIAQDNGALYVGTSGPSVIVKVGAERAVSGSVESDTMDAGRPAKWGRVDVSAEIPKGTRVDVETRSGDSSGPNANWSTWTPTIGSAITSPAARYLQYRLTLSVSTTSAATIGDGDEPATPIVRQVSISRRAQNQAPQVAIRAPEAGQRLSKQQSVKWQAQDPDKDRLSYTVDISPDLGATWTELAKNVRDTKCDWDTTKQKDGRYLLRVTASDRFGEPDDPLTDNSGEVVWVDNTPPDVLLFRASLNVDAQRQASVEATAQDKVSPIQSVEYRIDNEDWESVSIGAVESSLVAVSIRTLSLAVGKHKLSVRAFDAAGNVASESMEVSVLEPPAPPAGAEPASSSPAAAKP